MVEAILQIFHFALHCNEEPHVFGQPCFKCYPCWVEENNFEKNCSL